MERPKIKLRLEVSDWIMEIVGAFFLILMIGLPMYYFNGLPEVIPRHFNALGEPDGFSRRRIIWNLPLVGLILYTGMFFLNKYPHIFDYPVEITSKNSEKHYRLATKLIRAVNMLISVSFFYIVYSMIRTALSNEVNGLGVWFLPVFLLRIFATIGIYLYHAFKNNA